MGVVVAMIVCVAGFKVVSFLLNREETEEILEDTPEGQVEESALTKIIEQFMSMDTAEINLDVDVKTQSQNIGVKADVVVDMGKAQNAGEDCALEFDLGGFSVTIAGEVELESQTIGFDITYVDGYIFASVADVKIKMATSDVMEDVSKIMSLGLFEKLGVSVSLPALSLDGFDTSILMQLTQNIVEEKIENGIKISIDLGIFDFLEKAKVSLFTDENYVPYCIEIEEFAAQGIEVSGGVDTLLNTEIATITAPENSDEMVDVTEITSTISSFDKLLEKGKVSGNIDLTGYDFDFSGKYAVSFKDKLSVYFETQIASQPLVVRYINEKVFVHFGGYKYYISLADCDFNEVVTKIKELLNKYGYSLPQVDLSEIDTAQIGSVMGLLGNLEITEDNISLTTGELIARLVFANGEFDKIEVAYADAMSAKITLNEEIEQETFVENEYFGIEVLEKKLNTLIEQIKEKKLAANITLSLDNKEFDASVKIDYTAGLKAQIEFSYADYDVLLSYIDQIVYVNVNGLKLKYIVPENIDLNGLLTKIESLVKNVLPDFEMPTFDLDSVQAQIGEVKTEEILDIARGIDFTIAKATNEEIVLSVAGFEFALNLCDDKIASLCFDYENYGVNVEIQSNNFEISVEDDYIAINDTLTYIEPIFNLLKGQKVEFLTSTMVFGNVLEARGKVDFADGLKAEITISICGQEIKAYYIDGNCYVEYGTIYVKASVSEILDILEAEGLLEINVADKLDLDVFESITSANDLLTVVLNMGATISLDKTNNILTAVGFKYGDLNLNVGLSKFEGEITYVEKEKYISGVELFDFAKTILDVVTKEEIYLDITAGYGDIVVSGKVGISGNEIKAKLDAVVLERPLSIMLCDEQIYVDFDGLKLTCKLANSSDLVDYVTEYLGVKIELPEIDESLISSALDSIKIELENSVLMIQYADVALSIDAANKFNFVATYGDISAQVGLGSEFDFEVGEGYIDIYSLKELSKATFNTLQNLSVSGTAQVSLELFGEANVISMDYAIGYVDEKVQGYIETEFKGVEIKAYVDGEDIYVYVVGLKLHFNIGETEELITWINETFGLNISLDFLDDLIEQLKNSHLDFISTVVFEDGQVAVTLRNNMQIKVGFDEYIRTVEFKEGTREAFITCTDFNLINLDTLNREEYKDYTYFTPIIENLYNLIMSKQYDVSANVKIYNGEVLTNNISAEVELDITNMLNAYVNVLGLGEDITLYYQNKMLYVRYAGENGLKISIQENSIQEILAIVLSVLNVDTSAIPYLEEILQKDDLDTSNLGAIMPEISLGNPLQLLEYLSSFDIGENYLGINIKGEKLSSYAAGKDSSIKLYFENGKATSLEVSNIYINGEERLEIRVDFNEFSQVSKPSQSDIDNNKYIDISGSSDLIKSLVNTSQLNDYHVAGQLQFSVSLGSASINMAKINIDAKIKKNEIVTTEFDEEIGEYVQNKTNEIVGIVTLDNYPLVGLVNGSNTNGVGGITSGTIRARKITICLTGGYAYLFTEDEKWGLYGQLNRATKVSVNYLLGNLEYYMQYLLGFTDTIQSKINETIEASRNYTGEVKYGEIVSQYSHSGNSHTIVLNMAEIAHNGDIGELKIVITTLNNASTNNKDYLYRLDVDLKLFGGMLALSTDPSSSTTGLFLTDIGSRVSMNEFDNLINNYDNVNGLGENGEYKSEKGGAWKQENTGSVTLTLYSNGSVYTTVSGNIASALELPQIADIVSDDGNERVVRSFLGWFTDEAGTSEFTAKSYPRYSTTLYAKWSAPVVTRYSKVTFVTNEESIPDYFEKRLVGSPLELPVFENKTKQIDENTTILRVFKGWFIDETTTVQFNGNTFSENDIVIYAKWEEKITQTYNLTINFAGNQIYSGAVEAGETFNPTLLANYNETTKFFDEMGNEISSLTVEKDSVWTIKNQFKATIISSNINANGDNHSSQVLAYNGESIALPSFQNFTKDEGTYYIENKFLGYALNNDTSHLYTGSINMPSGDAKLEGVWERKEYVNVTFDITWAQPSGWSASATRKITCKQAVAMVGPQTIKVERGVAFDPSQYNATAKYEYKVGIIAKTYNFYVETWKTAAGAECSFSVTPSDGGKAQTVLKSLSCTEHTTLYPVWDAT